MIIADATYAILTKKLRGQLAVRDGGAFVTVKALLRIRTQLPPELEAALKEIALAEIHQLVDVRIKLISAENTDAIQLIQRVYGDDWNDPSRLRERIARYVEESEWDEIRPWLWTEAWPSLAKGIASFWKERLLDLHDHSDYFATAPEEERRLAINFWDGGVSTTLLPLTGMLGN